MRRYSKIARLSYFPITALLGFLCITGQTSAQRSGSSPDGVTFVAFNLKNYLPMERRVDGKAVVDAPKPEGEIAAVVAYLSAAKPDVLGVCEIGGRAEVEDLQERLRKKGINLPHFELTGGGDPDRRLALLSRFPIVERRSKSELTYRIGRQTLPVQRGILDVTVEINAGYRVRCLGIHLKSKREIPNADQALMRRNEAALVRKHADEILASAPDSNLLVYGDFNATRNEISVKEVLGRYRTPFYLTALRLEDDDGETWTHYWNEADVYARIDYICASRGIMPEIEHSKSYIPSHPDWYEASDHRPLLVHIMPVEKVK